MSVEDTMHDSLNRSPASESLGDLAARKLRSHESIVLELIKVLAPYPGGLRRWSVMRAIRSERERNSRNIPQKFEDEVERAFRQFCAAGEAKAGAGSVGALFFRPSEKAGEVWAVSTDRAKAWLDGGTLEIS